MITVARWGNWRISAGIPSPLPCSREKGHESPQGRDCTADPSLEPGEQQQRADSPAGRLAPASTRVGYTEPVPPGRSKQSDGGTELTAGRERAPSCLPGLPRSLPTASQRGPAFRKRGEEEKERRDWTRRDTNPTSWPERDAGGRAITFRVPRAKAWISPAAEREAVPAQRRS